MPHFPNLKSVNISTSAKKVQPYHYLNYLLSSSHEWLTQNYDNRPKSNFEYESTSSYSNLISQLPYLSIESTTSSQIDYHTKSNPKSKNCRQESYYSSKLIFGFLQEFVSTLPKPSYISPCHFYLSLIFTLMPTFPFTFTQFSNFPFSSPKKQLSLWQAPKPPNPFHHTLQINFPLFQTIPSHTISSLHIKSYYIAKSHLSPILIFESLSLKTYQMILSHDKFWSSSLQF